MGYNTFPCNPYPISTEELNKGNNDELNTRVAALEEDVSTLEGDVSDLNSNKASKSDIATEFSDLTNYFAGDLVYYEGALYEFQVDHTAGTWETSEVVQKDLSDIVTTLKSGLINHEIVVDAVNPTDTILYQKCIRINKLVVFSVKISIGATTASGNYIVGGLPKVSTTLGDNVALVACATNAKDISLAVANRADDGAVFSLENIETGKTIVLSGSYITQ